MQATYRQTAEYPAAGSPRYEFEFGFDGLRGQIVGGFSYIVFYVDRPDCVEIWRVLHAKRDVLAEPGAEPESEA